MSRQSWKWVLTARQSFVLVLALVLAAAPWIAHAVGAAARASSVAGVAPLVGFCLVAVLLWNAALRMAANARMNWEPALEAQEELELIREAVDSQSEGVAVFNRADHLVYWNARFGSFYPRTARDLRIGMSFEELLRSQIREGEIRSASGREEDWIIERLERRSQQANPWVRELSDQRWVRIDERRTEHDGTVVVITEVTPFMRAQAELTQARDAARGRATRLEEALEALPAGFELWDEEDRLVLCNSLLREQYPALAPHLKLGVRFIEMARASMRAPAASAGAIPDESWLNERVSRRGQSSAPITTYSQEDGHWRRIYERRMPSGATVGLRIDVTDLMSGRDDAPSRATPAPESPATPPAAAASSITSSMSPSMAPSVAASVAASMAASAPTAAVSAASRQDARLIDTLAMAASPILTIDGEGRILFANRATVDLFGYASDELLRLNILKLLADTRRLSRERRLDHFLGVDLAPQSRVEREVLARHRNGGALALHLSIAPLSVNGVREYAIVVTDFSERKRYEDELRRLNDQLSSMSTRDDLTGVSNRRLFEQRLTAEWTRSLRQHHPVGLLLIDIDDFKSYADFHGREIADRGLKEVAQAIQRAIRRSGEFVARYSGEEFVILLPNTDARGANVVARRCFGLVTAAQVTRGAAPGPKGMASLSVSIGVAARIASRREEPIVLVDAADRALAQARRRGGNLIETADDAV